MKTNPCNICLVKPCCTDVCKDKENYTEEIVDFLCRLGQHVYKENGKKRRNLSKLMTSAYNEAVQVCDINHTETNKIFNRHTNSVIP